MSDQHAVSAVTMGTAESAAAPAVLAPAVLAPAVLAPAVLAPAVLAPAVLAPPYVRVLTTALSRVISSREFMQRLCTMLQGVSER